MFISVQTLANAINEKRYIQPEPGMYRYNIQFVNRYGHIEKDTFIECKTDKAAVQAAKKEKFLFPECWIEILNLDTKKRIYT